MNRFFPLLIVSLMLSSCNNSSNEVFEQEYTPTEETIDLTAYFSIDFDNSPNYANQNIPNYINKDNTPTNNTITDDIAILGRILFYDKNLSSNNTISCASCHKQEYAFGDTNSLSVGVNGNTGRHSMRLVNARFSNEANFFWDERANSLEEQTTMPIQDHTEMGFSGENGDANFDYLIVKLENVEYYPELFTQAFGNETITENKIQNALAQFVRSIQSFDSKYDIGRNQVNDNQPFPNFTNQENQGKDLFNQPSNFDNDGLRIGGGIGCAGCHQGPEFDIDPNSRNNGVIGNGSRTGTDLTVTRSPSLRNVVKSNGESNGPFMHIGISNNLITVIEHYDSQINLAGNNNLDPKLRPNDNAQRLNMTDEEKNAVIAFIRTLSGSDVYTNEKWSNPFY